jgi:hypothetical protein
MTTPQVSNPRPENITPLFALDDADRSVAAAVRAWNVEPISPDQLRVKRSWP